MTIWWAAVAVAILGLGLGMIVTARDMPPLNVRQVVGDGTDLWAETYERELLQGVDVAWWASRDGGVTWSKAEPPTSVEDADPVTEVCTRSMCHRLVDGWRIEQRTAPGGPWEIEYERPPASSPTGYEGYAADWEEVPAIATTSRSGSDEVVVAAGRDGALVRTVNGSWTSVAVGEPSLKQYLPWLFAILAMVIVLCGVAGHFLIGWRARRHERLRLSSA